MADARPTVAEIYDDWVECWSCAGQGHHEDCFEDTCVCLSPPCRLEPCDVCRGQGGWNLDDEEPAS